MFYHVIVKFDRNGQTLTKVDYNLTKDEIIKKYVTAYNEKKSFRMDGYVINFDSIERFKITTTEHDPKMLANYESEQNGRAGILVPVGVPYIIQSDKYSNDVTDEFLGEPKEFIDNQKKLNQSKNVFIVHGHDEAKRNAVSLLLTQQGLNPIVLCEQPSGGNTIIEKIDEYASDVCYGIVIYTQCDIGYDKVKGDTTSKPRARQNVIFEHGYLIGKYGRGKVCALVDGDIEIPGDLGGIVYIPFDNSGKWKYDLGKEMHNAGIEFDLYKIR